MIYPRAVTLLSACFWMVMMTMMPLMSEAYDIGCIYPSAMPDPLVAQDIMIKYTILIQETPLETPIAVHNALVSAMCGVGCLAMHDPFVKNPISRQRPLLVAPEYGHNAYSIAMCSLQCHTLGTGYDRMKPLLDRWNANITEGPHPQLAFLAELQGEPQMQDLLRAVQVVKDNDYHPFLMGQLVLAEIYTTYLLVDGWNGFGNYSYDINTQSIVPCTANCMAFADTSGYYPRNHPGRPSSFTEETKYNVTGDDRYWQPLLEDNGIGYFSRQQHVVPHVATTAKPMLDDNLRNKTLPPPNYQYYEEALKVVEELRLTAEDPDRRAKIKVFDDKLDVRGLFQFATTKQFSQQHSYQRHLLYVLGLSMAEDDAVILAWTEKIRHDLVRPTTVIQRWGRDKLLTYGGDPSLNQAMKLEARNFEAFIRVMPHSEYPSGSACLCTTYREFADAYTMQNYGDKIKNIQYGPRDDGHQTNCNGEVGRDLPTGGCDYSFSLKDMTELEEVCGQSRLWGGMHFTKSVPAGHELCSGLGSLALERVNELTADSNFGGNEWYLGDERPVCSDPAAKAEQEEEEDSETINGEQHSSTTSMLGCRGARKVAMFLVLATTFFWM